MLSLKYNGSVVLFGYLYLRILIYTTEESPTEALFQDTKALTITCTLEYVTISKQNSQCVCILILVEL